MGFLRRVSVFVLVLAPFLLVSCVEQYDPAKNNAKFAAEWHQAEQPLPKLTATGEIPAVGGEKKVDAEERYATICANCHGAQGGGDGPGGAALVPKPRNFHDKAWQASVDDARIIKVIGKGGASVGLSAAMSPWSSVLSPEEIVALSKKIRAFGQ